MFCAFDGGANDARFFVAEQTLFAGVRIECADADSRAAAFEFVHDAVNELRFGQNGFRRQVFKDFGQCHVERDVYDTQTVRRRHGEIKHHGEILHAAELGEQFGMAGIMMAGAP